MSNDVQTQNLTTTPSLQRLCQQGSTTSHSTKMRALTVRSALTAEVLAACGPPVLMVSEMALLYSLQPPVMCHSQGGPAPGKVPVLAA